MAIEHDRGPAHPQPVESARGKPLRAIHVVFEAVDGQQTRLSLTPQGSFYLASHIAALAGAPITERSVERLIPDAPAPPATPEPAADATPEKPAAVTLTGKLKTKPREGRPDSRGKPTAWAMLAVHVQADEGASEAKMYAATFHRHTTKIALGLNAGDRLTVQGYPCVCQSGTAHFDHREWPTPGLVLTAWSGGRVVDHPPC